MSLYDVVENLFEEFDNSSKNIKTHMLLLKTFKIVHHVGHVKLVLLFHQN